MGIMSSCLLLEGGGLTPTHNSGGMVSLGKAREQEGTHHFVLQWEGWRDGVLPILPASRRVDLLLEPPQRRGPAARGFVEMPRIPPRQWQGSNRG